MYSCERTVPVPNHIVRVKKENNNNITETQKRLTFSLCGHKYTNPHSKADPTCFFFFHTYGGFFSCSLESLHIVGPLVVA